MKTDPFLPTATEEIRLVDISTVSGTFQDGIDGNYGFSIIDVIKEAWQKTYGVKGTFWVAWILAVIISGLIVGVMSFFSMDILQPIVMIVVLIPLFVGIAMIGVRRSVELPVRFLIIFDYFGYVIPIVIAFFLINFFVIIGLVALIIPGIYLSIAYFFTMLLIVEKNLGPWKAMEASRKAVTHHWFKVFFTLFLMNIILTISMFLFVIPLIWTLPMMVNVIGILYRIMFGVEAAR